MPWATSNMSRQMISDLLGNVTAMDWDADTIKVALYDNSITPDKDATAANYAYAGTGVWASTGSADGTTHPQIFQAVQWPQGGQTLGTKTNTTPSSGITQLGAANTASGSACTVSNAYGAFVYSDSITTPVAKQGWCHNYFGGTPGSVSNGTLTVIWSANGLLRVTAN